MDDIDSIVTVNWGARVLISNEFRIKMEKSILGALLSIFGYPNIYVQYTLGKHGKERPGRILVYDYYRATFLCVLKFSCGSFLLDSGLAGKLAPIIIVPINYLFSGHFHRMESRILRN